MVVHLYWVNRLTGCPVAPWSRFWTPLDEGRALVDSWIWSHVAMSWHAAQLMGETRLDPVVQLGGIRRLQQEGMVE